MKKIMEFLFQNKKRKTITICSLVLVVVILLSAILIPVVSNMNKSFKSEEEMLSYMTGVYLSGNKYIASYFIFDEENKLYCDFTQGDFSYYFTECLKETSDIQLLKDMTFEECINNMMKTKIRSWSDVEFQYKKGRILFDDGKRSIEIKRDSITMVSGEETYSITKLADSPLACDEMKENFEKAKKDGVSVKGFLPSTEELDQRLIDTGLNTAFSMNFLKGVYDKDKSMTLINTQYTGFDKIFEVIYQYMKDIPGFSEDAKGEIRIAMENGEVRDALKGTAICAEFTLYGIEFITTYKPLSYPKNVQYTGYSSIVITMKPSSISLSN